MPKRTKARRVARRAAQRRRVRCRTVAAPVKSRHQQLVELVLLRERSRMVIECWVLDAQLAMFTGDLKELAKSLRRLGNPAYTDVVDHVLDERLWRQLEVARLRGWSPEHLEELAGRAMGEARLSYLLDALAERSPESRPSRVDAMFVDLWLTIVSIYECPEVPHAQAG